MRHLILLAGPVEQPVLASALRAHNPDLTIHPVATLAELDAFGTGLLARARLIGFCTSVIVPRRVLQALGFGAYNFHPGPPEYPGWIPAQFALYENAAEFGATAHVMIEEVDAGPIIAVARFPVPAQITVRGLEALAYARLARLFWQLAPFLAAQQESLPHIPVRWHGPQCSRRRHAAVCDVPLDIPREELDRKIRAFGNDSFETGLTVSIHGHRFRYVHAGAPSEESAVPHALTSAGLQNDHRPASHRISPARRVNTR